MRTSSLVLSTLSLSALLGAEAYVPSSSVPQLLSPSAPRLLSSSAPRPLRVRDAQPLRMGIQDWIKDQVQQNMGQKDDPTARKEAEVKAEVADSQPEYNYKFAGKLADKLAQSDVQAALDSAVDNSRKVKKVKKDGKGAVVDERYFELALERPTGIEFATDLSLKYVYVMEVKDNSPANLSPTPVEVGDQLVGINGEECIGSPFKEVAGLLAKEPTKPLTFRFFRGTKQDLLEAVGREDWVPTDATITALEPDGKETQVTRAAGANVRDALIEEEVQVYNIAQGRFTNCNGKQLCGTCIVEVLKGQEFTNSKSLDEENFLRKMPENYRLSCCLNVYGDVKLKTRPKTNKKLIEFT